MEHIKITFSKKKFDRVTQVPASNGSKMGPKSTFWGIYTVTIIAIWIKKNWCFHGSCHSDLMLLLVQKKNLKKIPKRPSASANGRAKIMFGMTMAPFGTGFSSD
jgi:hypothetical protein